MPVRHRVRRETRAWLRSGSRGHADFPGRYLFALLPLLAAAGMLRLLASQIAKVLPDPSA